MVLCLLLLPGMAGAGTGADSPEKKAASAVNNKRNVRQKITPVGYSKVYLGTPFVRMRGES